MSATTDPSTPTPEEPAKSRDPLAIALRILLPLGILTLAYFGFKKISEPAPAQALPRPEATRLETRACHVEPGDFDVMLQTQGIVQARLSAAITPQVNGRLAKFSDAFEAGIFVNKGELLAELDQIDFQAAVARAEAALARAEAALAQEEARARQARRNWDELDFDEAPSPLVLREPQLKEARATLASARAELAEAELSLERTAIRAPFDGLILERSVGLGERVGPGAALGTMISTDHAEVRLPLSPRQLALLDHEAFKEKRPVTFTDALNPDLVTQEWQGWLLRPEGQVDEETREVFVIARIDDPFGLKSGQPGLRIGLPIRASFRATTFKEVVSIPREAMQSVNGVIEVTGGVIAKHKIDPIWTTPSELIVRDQFMEGADLAINQLPFAPSGAPIDILPSANETAPAQAGKQELARP